MSAPENDDRRRDTRRADDRSRETRDAMTERDIEELHEDIEDLRNQLRALKDEHARRQAEAKAERDKFLIWGIVTLGAIVFGMGTWIVKLFADKVNL